MNGLFRYLRHLRPHWPAFAAAALLLSLSALVPGAAVVLLQQALDTVLAGARPGWLTALAAAFAGLYLLAAAAALLRTWVTKGVAWRVAADLRSALHHRYLALPPHAQDGTGARLAALTSEVDEVQYGVSALVTAFRNPLTLAVLAATAVAMAPSLAVWALVLVPAVGLATHWGGRRLRRRAVQARQARSGLVALAQEQLAGLQTVQDFAAEAGEHARFARLADADRSARLALEVERVVPRAAVQLVAAIGIAVLLVVGGRQVLAGSMAPGQLVGFAVALGLMHRPLAGLSEVWSLLQRSLASLERVYDALDTAPVERPAVPVPLPDGPLAVCWRGVTVDYGDGPVVRDVSLEVPGGGRLAVVGETGAGKTSLLALVARHVDPVTGLVSLGGVDVGQLDPARLRREVAIVRQEPFLFARTIAENLALGRPGATRSDIEQAAWQAGADAFVRDLPRGYDTPLDELGRRLSGGERQRLCLARALVTRARVLLLDEATAHLDALTAARVLSDLPADRTVVLVTHDLDHARRFGQIAVLRAGRLVDQGDHGALIAGTPAYAALWRARGPG